MTVTENVMLGWQNAGRWPRPRQLAELIRTTSSGYGLDIDPDATVGRLSYGQRQRVEIIKALMRGSDLLILDEPTSNLSPPEVSRLLTLMRRLRGQGRSVIFISHKLGEVLDVCDDIVVLRDGVVTGRCSSVDATRAELAHMMVGRDVTAPIEPWAGDCGDEILTVTSLSLCDEAGIERLRDVHFSLHAGEILSVAGVDGNGQAELVEVIAGLRLPDRGRIVFGNRDVSQWNARARAAAGIAYIPVDRANMSLVLGMTVEDNLAKREIDRAPLSRWCW